MYPENTLWSYKTRKGKHMDENYTSMAVHIQEIDSRSRSNEHRLDDHEKEIHKLQEKQDAIYDLASSVKSIAIDMTYIKEDMKEVKTGQDDLNEKVAILENRPANETKKRVDGIIEKLLWLLIGGIAAILLPF